MTGDFIVNFIHYDTVHAYFYMDSSTWGMLFKSI